jgi:hypothetical protein
MSSDFAVMERRRFLHRMALLGSLPYDLNGMFRTPHIHFAVSRGGERLLTTQMMVRGHPDNERDRVLQGVREAAARESVLVEFVPVGGSKIGELSATFEPALDQPRHRARRGEYRLLAPAAKNYPPPRSAAPADRVGR